MYEHSSKWANYYMIFGAWDNCVKCFHHLDLALNHTSDEFLEHVSKMADGTIHISISGFDIWISPRMKYIDIIIDKDGERLETFNVADSIDIAVLDDGMEFIIRYSHLTVRHTFQFV